MKRMDREELKVMASADYDQDHFCGLISETFRLFLTDKDFSKAFIEKNNVQACVDLRELTFPDGLGTSDDKRAFIGLASGARAIHDVVQNCGKGNSVIVHCKEGKERTPSAVIYYLIRYHNLNGEESKQLVLDALALRYGADLSKTSTSLSHYYDWLEKQTQQSLKKYEVSIFAIKEANAYELASSELQSLYRVFESDEHHPKVLQVKESKYMNQVIRSVKQTEKASEKLDLPGQVKKEGEKKVSMSDEKASDTANPEEKMPVQAQATSSHAKIMGALSNRRSARLNAQTGDEKVLHGTYKGKVSEKIRFSSPPTKGKPNQESVAEVKADQKSDLQSASPSSSEEEQVQEESSMSTRRRFGK